MVEIETDFSLDGELVAKLNELVDGKLDETKQNGYQKGEENRFDHFARSWMVTGERGILRRTRASC